MSSSFLPLSWDTEHFGFPIGQLKLGDDFLEKVPAVLKHASQNGTQCVYCLVDTHEIEKRVFLENAGFHLMDLRLSFSKKLKDEKFQYSKKIETAKKEDELALRRLAETSFKDSRFWNDSQFDKNKVQKLYSNWLVTELFSPHPIFVVRENKKIAGFLSTKKTEKTGKISLIAVDPQFQGKGIGRELIEKTCEYFLQENCDTCEVVTQAQNLLAQALYQKAKFISQKSELYYHKWFDSKKLKEAA